MQCNVMYVCICACIYLFVYLLYVYIYFLACQADAIAAARYLTEEALAKCAGAPLNYATRGRSCGELPTAAEDTAEISEAFVITIILSFR